MEVTEAEEASDPPPAIVEETFAPGTEFVTAGMTANVYKVLVQPGDRVEDGQTLIITESMKTEVHVSGPAGEVLACLCAVGQLVQPEQRLIAIKPQRAAV